MIFDFIFCPLSDFRAKFNKFLADGWTPFGYTKIITRKQAYGTDDDAGVYAYQGFRKDVAESPNQPAPLQKPSQEFLDLLEINQINVFVDESRQVCLIQDGQEHKGISSNTLVQFLSVSKHVPIDMSQAWAQIEAQKLFNLLLEERCQES